MRLAPMVYGLWGPFCVWYARPVTEETRTCKVCNVAKPVAEFSATGEWRKSCRSCALADKARRERDRKARIRAATPDFYVRRRAASKGLDLEVMLALERLPCEVCGAEAPEAPKHNNVYVRPDNKAVTGTLCQPCTKALGTWEYDADLVRAALALMTSDTDHRKSTP